MVVDCPPLAMSNMTISLSAVLIFTGELNLSERALASSAMRPTDVFDIDSGDSYIALFSET